MIVDDFVVSKPEETAQAVRSWFVESARDRTATSTVRQIAEEVITEGDEALVRLTERYDGVSLTPGQIKVDPAEAQAALEALPRSLREALELAEENIRTVAAGQVSDEAQRFVLGQGQTVTVRELPVGAVGIYAPGGQATYPSSVLMCAIPARVAGVERIALVSPPMQEGRPSGVVLAAAALCGIDEIYAVGGAQSITALAWGTETIPRVDVVVGPGNVWVQEAKRHASGQVGIESYAGPSELMVVAGPATDSGWAAADLCAQAEHGADSPLVLAAVERDVLKAIAERVVAIEAANESVAEARLALVEVSDPGEAIEFANQFAPEHLELLDQDAAQLADRVTTAGCVFVGPCGATAFGDYVAGSNHVLPTMRSGRFSGPLGPGTFRRKISTVEVPPDAAAKLAPHVDTIARAEGLPVHGESAMIRARL